MADRFPQASDALAWLLSRTGSRRRQRPEPPYVRAGLEPPGFPAPPPPSPPLLNRIAGAILLAATLGLTSCQAFIAAVT